MGRAPNRRLSFEKRVEILSKINPHITLIDDYQNETTKKYWCHFICSCGNKNGNSTWNDLQSNKKCPQCANNRTLSFEERVELLKERNPEVILISLERNEKGDRYDCTYKTTFDETLRVREWTNLISKHKVIKHPDEKLEDKKVSFENKKKLIEEKQPEFELLEQFWKYDRMQIFYKYKCKCGSIVENGRWKDLYRGTCCQNCKETNLLSIEDKQKILNETQPGTIIISQYVNGKGASVCKYICKKCKKEHEKMWSNIRLSGLCDECSPNRKYTLDERKEILKTKNPDVELISEFFKDGDWWVKYKCSCGSIDEKIWEHIREGAHCMQCSGKRRYTLEQRKEILKDSNPEITLIRDFMDDNGNIKCEYICKCGDVYISSFQHLRLGGTCFSCGIKKISDKLKFTLGEVKEKLAEINKNVEIIDDVYIDSKTKLKCRCKIDKNIFYMDWETLRGGSGCPKCIISRGESRVLRYLETNKFNYTIQKQYDDLFGVSGYRKLSYDFYLPDYNILIEYDGMYHFEPIVRKARKNVTEEDLNKANKRLETQQIHDKLKTEYANNNGIKLIRITHKEHNKIEEILDNELIFI